MGQAPKRCAWAGDDPLYQAYHDREWGVPCRDERRLFEFLLLEGAQAGLSWITILRKRENYRAAFDDFDPERIARYGPERIADLLENPGIVRNRLKIHSAVNNARACLEAREAFGSFSDFIWGFVDGVPRINHWRHRGEVPVRTPVSDAMSRELRRRGFTFAGSTICYAYMQAVGMVNDHTLDCFRHRACGGERREPAALKRRTE
ncbi:MAG: DNA-3-methyladenine glycosylase [Candidatus Sedimenticola endophacoides]|uniref:DNA-3-methyladenine glycosylase I n=2 Tax=Candidatus Sedimenticola endophacoides TaxID=2548426 RepID=A0A657Q2R1_9GAMM|nr:MAG: DNA-3-methyladenine glycosylase [Candidatus Sedimenticola endophacoides]OQX34549.1 MAG: DNA-3-methyladenine glycosylase [Candidatus Sedimenticola endophacoides]OQX41659.1 MAG: DNA-3-methyladenine glycosylase [Candidatus Sedimenticola endophacoides]OQX46983.1 MAG: DNA-3-methyladenine glycosylase [Candidatus Sedimenticola endophacoides]OQX47223.1 MAG: DNA-3-methyladenine glycosylase [Candidatus Sedimenticola endophacoides]